MGNMTVTKFIKAANDSLTNYNDGLINRGEFVRTMRASLDEIEHDDLLDAKRTVQSYGHEVEDVNVAINSFEKE